MSVSVDVVHGSMTASRAKCRAIIVAQSCFQECMNRAAALCPDIAIIAKQRNFVGKAGSTLVVPVVSQDEVHNVLLVGMGDANRGERSIEFWRRAIGTIILTAKQIKASTISIELTPIAIGHATTAHLLEQGMIAAMLAGYDFDTFITSRDTSAVHAVAVEFYTTERLIDTLQHARDRAEIIGKAVNEARELKNLPANILNPIYVANYAKEFAHKNGLKYTVFGREEMINMGMGGITGVGQGSDNDPQLVILEYSAPVSNAPTVAFVGKGITFDSGGLSIKPAKSMEQMKHDMSGAAAVLQAIIALAQLKCPINVISLMPLAENMLGGNAMRPGDIIKFYNGKTAEVLNTDAEGRLILADALSYAVQHYKPNAIIDVATLTGACAAALGPFYSGMFSEHEELAQQVAHAGEISGDPVWRLPLNDYYKPALKSHVADLSNIGQGSYSAGATTAALFLQNFVGNTPWVHLDIAGTAYGVPDISYYDNYTATGTPTRLLINLAMNYKA